MPDFHSSNSEFFMSLYDGDTSVCQGDHSLAVIMLANQLAMMTDLDAERMKQLLFQTKLARPKWDEMRGQNMLYLGHLGAEPSNNTWLTLDYLESR